MICSDKEAKEKICCSVMYDRGRTCCLGTECMAWYWYDAAKTVGYCGIARRT